MSTDSTELTFVRCPSCRSLVPAVSTRCRMCGAALDASQKSEEPEPVEKPSRVRQRTMSQPENELSSAAGRLRGEVGEAGPGQGVEAPTIDGQNPVESEGNNADPLSAYIEEVEVEEGHIGDTAPGDDAGGDSAGSVFEESGASQAKQPASMAKEPEFLAAVEKSTPTADEKKPSSVDAGKFPQGEATKPEGDFQPVGEGRSRVIIESGTRRSGKPGGLSFGRSHEETSVAPGDYSGKGGAGREQGPAHSRGEGFDRPSQRGREREGFTSRHDDQFNRRHQERGFERRQREPQQQAARREDGRPSEQHALASKERPTAGAKREESGGRLFGWLVSYANPNGTATELREGRFFVSRSSLKPNDLLLDDASVSTPHALMNVSVNEGLHVQDLMSERGVFVRRRSGDSYQRVTETVKIEGGEWVRFGDVEFLVCLVAHGSTK